MPNYDFKNLSPIDFEILVRDLLQKELKIRLESFKAGKDKGIDFRYSELPFKSWIIQAKNFVGSGFSKLLKELDGELPKIIKLKPKRYILATSVALSPLEKEKIIEKLSPFVVSEKDVYGKDDLNNLLQLYPEIEKQTFKLWLSSVGVLEEILHGRIKNFSRDSLEKIKANAKVYVQNDSFQEALDKLLKQNVCIVAGIPGIGKTTLAEMLILHFVNQGYELVKINYDISEVNYLDHSTTNRIYYYDDFLGQTSLAEKLHKNEDQGLINFIDTIRTQKKSKLLLTTREYILNQAKKTYEKLENANIDYNIYVIDLEKYTRSIRAKILYNHLYFSELPSGYKEKILTQKRYLKIVDHKNYSPRIINFMTDPIKVEAIREEDYFSYFIENLNNPLAIWRHAYESQISNESRELLICLLTLPREVELEELNKAFQQYHIEKSRSNFSKINDQDFKNALKELTGNFVINDHSWISFQNPSVRDFLQNTLLKNQSTEIPLLVNSSIYFNQLRWMWNFKSKDSKTFKKTIKEIKKIFNYQLEKTFVSTNVSKIAFDLLTLEWLEKKNSWSMESRLTILISMVKELGKTDIEPFIFTKISELQENMVLNKVNPSDLLELALEIKNSFGISDKKYLEFLLEIRNHFLKEKDDVGIYKLLESFSEGVPELFTKEELIKLENDFDKAINKIYEYAKLNCHSADEIQEIIRALDNVSGCFGIETINQITDLEDYLKEDLSEETNEDDALFDDISDKDNDCTDDDIESMFKTME